MSSQTAVNIEGRVRAIVGEVLWVAADELTPDAPLIDYGLDSPRAIELTIGLEREFGIVIPEDVAAQLNTVGEIVAHMTENLL